MKELSEQIQCLCRKAKEASRFLSELSSKKIDQALIAIGEELLARKATVLAANDRDIDNAKIWVFPRRS
ncbi:hypothetical protein kam1_882 [Methylacidiphilum kamchatkense Kam1]|uniref:Glutamate-5-semialdehyde dehydrogenase n=1 Tax=Methylacidiphilum kamchatkense Kam1 TaxID=1202785 RepID=A0A516TLK5_9BACT|nr:hypothetical protein kam1_882 [Methylacidiphilum kamchatkense Kam1]